MSANGTLIITGGSGLIGSALVNRLARDHQVVAFDEEGACQ